MTKKVSITLLFCFISMFGWGATYPAASSSRTDVITAIGLASNGDTVTIPSGNSTWDSHIPLDKEIAIIGDGKDSTVITGYGFQVSNGTDNWRVAHIGFVSNTNSQNCLHVGSGNDSIGCHAWRFDHCKVTDFDRGIFTYAYVTGVIDNNDFLGYRTDGLRIWGENAGAWTKTAGFGTGDFIFIEDNYFYNGSSHTQHFVTGEEGGKWVLRHNTFEEGSNDVPDWIDNHGYGHGPTSHAGRAFEIYENTFVKGVVAWARCVRLRGGSGVVFDNTFDEAIGSFNTHIVFTDYRAAKYGGLATPTMSCSTSMYCPTADGGEGYPCCEQIGRGQGGSHPQPSDPVYVWGNKDHNAGAISATVDANVATYIQIDRDYYASTRPSYTSYTYPHPLRNESDTATDITLVMLSSMWFVNALKLWCLAVLYSLLGYGIRKLYNRN